MPRSPDEEKEAEPGDETTPAGAGSFVADILEDIEKPDSHWTDFRDPALKYDLSPGICVSGNI